MKISPQAFFLLLALCGPAFAQHRGSSVGSSGAILVGLVVVVAVAVVFSVVQRSFRTFFPTLGGLLLTCFLSGGGAAIAENAGLVHGSGTLWFGAALFLVILAAPALVELWRHRRRAGA